MATEKKKNVLMLYHIITSEFPNSESFVGGRSIYRMSAGSKVGCGLALCSRGNFTSGNLRLQSLREHSRKPNRIKTPKPKKIENLDLFAEQALKLFTTPVRNILGEIIRKIDHRTTERYIHFAE